MAKQPGSRVPSALGSIPLVGNLARSADTQAQWLRDLLEQNARLLSQLPATLKSFNDTLERFNQTVGRLDAVVTTIETAGRTITGPVEKLTASLDPQLLREIPEVVDALRREAVPALQAAADTQRQVELMQSSIDRILGILGELPGAGMLRRLATGRLDAPPPETPGQDFGNRG